MITRLINWIKGLTPLVNHFDPGLLVAAILPLIGIIPTFGDGVIKTADGPLHVQRIFAMSTLLHDGNLWPRWVPWFHLGYGYPIFNFYPPGVFYLGGVLGILGVPAPLAFTIIGALAWMLGSVGTYALTKRFLPAYAALLAAMLWSYAPSRLYEVWDQGSLPQIMAAALVSWVVLGIVRAAQYPSRRNLAAIALPFAGIIFCHQPITLISGLYIAPAALILPLGFGWGERKTIPKRLICTTSGLLLGAGLAAIFLLPMALELRYVKAASEAPDVIPYLISNFLQPAQIFSQPQAMDLTDLRFELPTTLGLVGGVLAPLGLLALIRQRRYGLALLLTFGLAFTLFMLLEISLPVWRTIPFMAQLRFPERFLRVGALLIALAGSASLLWLPRRWQTAGLVVTLTVVLAAGLPMAYPTPPFINWPSLSALDEIRMEETEHIWGSTSYDEFNPLWGEKPGWDPAVEPEEYITAPLRIVVNRLDMIRQWPDLQVEQIDNNTVRVTVASARPVRFRQFFFPGWTATLDEQPVEIYPEEEIGQITLDVPAGEHIIRLNYAGTTVQAIGALITLGSIGVVGLLLLTEPKTRSEPVPRWAYLSRKLAWGIGGGVIGFAVLNALLITPYTTWFRQQSTLDTPAYMQTPLHVTFGDTFELLGFTLEQERVAPGQLFRVMLFWRALRPLDQEYHPTVQIINLSQSQAWAVSEPFFPGGGHTDRGYPLDRFASEVHTMRVFDFAPPYVGRVSIQMVEADTDQALLLPNGADRLLLEPLIRIEGGGPDIPNRLNYQLGENVQLRCASVQRDGSNLKITLGWHVITTPNQDMVVFVHGLDANGDKVDQNDMPPLGPDYPSTLWQPNQNLLDQHSLPHNSAIESVAVGLYTPDDGQRLTVSQDDQLIPDNRIIVPLTENSCLP